MLKMKKAFLLLTGLVFYNNCIAGELDNISIQDPILLASGSDYTIQAFHAQLGTTDIGWGPYSVGIRPGFIIFHTDKNTSKKSLLLKTGVFRNPTRRPSYTTIRLLGMYQTSTQLATVYYLSKRFFRQSPDVPPTDGGYYLRSFEKITGKEVYTTALDYLANMPTKVPEETLGAGIIGKTDYGFTVLNQQFSVNANGKIQRIPNNKP